VISLKRHIDAFDEDLLRSTRNSFRDSLDAMGTSAALVCPHLGEGLHTSLTALQQKLVEGASSDVVASTGNEVRNELNAWGKGTAQYLKTLTEEVKGLLLTVADSTKAVADRDQTYAKRLDAFAGTLRTIGQLDDITRIRESIQESATQIKACVEAMVEDGEKARKQLQAEVTSYQSRLDEAEQVAAKDPMTGLANRRRAERQLLLRFERNQPFCVALLDLNGFKLINDTYGHAAGDEVVKMFAEELRSFFRSTDLVCRWGGDEFLVTLDGTEKEATSRIQPLREKVCGDYTLRSTGTATKVKVGASIGLAAWRKGEPMADLITRADKAMYEDKQRSKLTAPGR